MKLHDFVRYNRLTSSEVPEEDESTDVCHELKTQLCLNQYDLRFCALVLSLLISVVLNILLILAHLNAKHVDGECPSAFGQHTATASLKYDWLNISQPNYRKIRFPGKSIHTKNMSIPQTWQVSQMLGVS